MSHLPALIERPELAVPEPETLAVLDAEYREVVRAPRAPRRGQGSKSVVLPASLVALAIFAAPVAVYAVLAWSTQP